MPTFTAVDVGANSVRLKIARLVRRRLQVVHEDREVTRLGESVFRTGLLAPAAMARTVKVLRRFHRAAQKYGADVVRVVATSALRDARNAQAFMDWVHSATGWRVEIISGLEEGRLIHLGIRAASRTMAERMLMLDLGGGSCELTLSLKGHIRQMFSLPLGAVRLTQEFLRHDPPKEKEMGRLSKFVAEELARITDRIASARVQLTIATSGTAAALAARSRSLPGRPRRRRSVSRADVLKMATELARKNLEERASLPGIGPRRAEIIVAGATVFAELMERCELPVFRYSPLGLRDGLLAQMAADYDRGTRSRKQVESDRWDALLAAGRHYHVDMVHAQQVRRIALDLFSALQRMHYLPGEYEEWLSAAAMLHEVGGYVNRTGRHRHTYYIIANSEIFGYTPEQRRVIATIARYLGKTRPSPADRLMKPLAVADREHVPKAVVLLRLASALNQGRRGIVTGLRTQVQDGRVVLFLKTKKRTGAELEMWALEKERSYFRAVFGRELVPRLS